jgi:beta-galactosidase
MIHDARTNAVSVNDIPVEGFYGDIVPTSAKVLARFDDGRPAITEAQIGRGSAVLIGFDAARMCWKPRHSTVEALIAGLVMGNERMNWECNAPMAFRLSTTAADHYFLLNDGVARSAIIRAYDRVYAAGEYVIEGTPLDVRGTISVELPKQSAVWLRFAR